MRECRLTKKAEPPPTRDVNRDSGTASANGGWLRRLVRLHRHGQSVPRITITKSAAKTRTNDETTATAAQIRGNRARRKPMTNPPPRTTKLVMKQSKYHG